MTADKWHRSLGHADEGPGLEEHLDDALVPATAQALACFGRQVVGQHAPRLLGGQIHDGDETRARLRVESPLSRLGDEMPGAMDWAADPDGHTVTLGSCDDAEPVRVGPAQGA